MKFGRLLSRFAAVLVAATFAASSVQAGLIEEIQDRGVLKVGMAESPPWQSKDTHMLQFPNTFIQDFVRNGEHITLRDHWFDLLAERD